MSITKIKASNITDGSITASKLANTYALSTDSISAGTYANTAIANASSASLYANTGITLAQAAYNSSNTGTSVNLAYTGTLTGGTGILNIGSGQIYKDASGNVGIGTSTTTNAKLTVNGLTAKVGDSISTGIYAMGDTNVTASYVGMYRGTAASISSGNWLNLGGYDGIAFTTGAAAFGSQTERMRIDSSGNVGIGTSSPVSKLNINGNVGIGTLTGDNAYNPTSNSLIIQGNNQAGLSTYAAIGNSTSTGIISYYSDSSAGFARYLDIVAIGSTGGAGSSIRFLTGSASATERMRIDSSGNVGIGTSSPGTTLHVKGGGNPILKLETSGNVTTGGYNYLTFWDSSNSQTGFIGYGGVANLLNINNNLTNGSIAFNTGASYLERMRIDSSGNVGIGTSSPGGNKLSVAGCIQSVNNDGNGYALRIVAGTAGKGTIQFTNAAATNDWGYLTYNSSGKSVWRTAAGSPNNSSNSAFDINGGAVVINNSLASGGDTGDWPMPTLGLKNYDSNFNGLTQLIFGYRDDDVTYETGSAKWNFRFWGTSGATTSSASTELHLKGPGPLEMMAGSGGVRLTVGATSWVSASDERLKDIIEPITGAIDKISSLRTVIGKFKTDDDGVRRPFLIAQDVQKVFPEAVTSGLIRELVDPENPLKVLSESEYLLMGYSDMVPLIIASVKEQQTLIETLTARLTALEAK